MSPRGKAATIVTLGIVGAFAGITGASAGGGCHGGVTEAEGTRVELIGACFTPTTLFAEPGETITFVNRDDFEHNITANDWGHFGDLQAGDRYTTSFKTDGIYAYACTYHPGMSGAIVVGRGGAGVADEPVTASAAPTSADGGSAAAGAIGLLIGAAAGVGITAVRRRAGA